MFTLPQIVKEDVQELGTALAELISKSEATTALIIDKGGFVLTTCGAVDRFDTTTLAALAAGSYSATQAIASLIGEPDFSSVYQQGESFSLLVSNVNEQCLLLVIFPAHLSVGAVKYYAAATLRKVAHQLDIAYQRTPEEGLDLSISNMADPSDLFHRKEHEPQNS
jgi:predicted regulator of Ras-like GTPase activity (Roadblock/LC7/MglB family)